MKAAVLKDAKGIGSLTIEDVPAPEPAAGEVRVQIVAAAINRRDVRIAQGQYPNMSLPCILGSDGAGAIDQVGAGVDATLLGNEVVIYPAANWGDDPRAMGPEFKILGMPDPGTFAEFICVPASAVAPKPAHLSWAEAAAVPLAGLTAWRAVVTHAETGKGQTVLVTGAGSGVSTFAIQWAARLGARVYVTSGSPAKIAAARALGASDGVLYTESGWDGRLNKLSGGFDIVVDSAGGDNFDLCLGVLKPGGRYVFFGSTLGNPSRGLNLRSIFWRQIRLQGTTMGTPAEFRAMLEFVTRNHIRPAVDSVLPIARIRDAVQRVLEFGQTGKVVLQIMSDP